MLEDLHGGSKWEECSPYSTKNPKLFCFPSFSLTFFLLSFQPRTTSPSPGGLVLKFFPLPDVGKSIDFVQKS